MFVDAGSVSTMIRLEVNRTMVWNFGWRMILSENRFPLFGIML